MRLVWLELAGFRTYRELRFQPGEGLNIIGGLNGAGKTNLLEAIGYLTSLRSFRGASDEALVNHQSATAVIRAEIERGESTALVELEINRGGKRRVMVNRQRLARVSDLLGVVRAVPFLPEDLEIVKGGPSGRREVLDELGVALWPAAALDLSEYERALRQRNALLRFGRGSRIDAGTLDAWDVRMSQAGGRLMERRTAALLEVISGWRDAYETLAGHAAPIGVAYESGWGGELEANVSGSLFAERLLAALRAARHRDVERGLTTVGLHRDDPTILLDGHDVRLHASQGEQRSLIIGLRLAAHAAIGEAAGSAALLLLDDVFSELDPERSQRLIEVLPVAQTFLTSARPEDVPVAGKLWTVDGGGVW